MTLPVPHLVSIPASPLAIGSIRTYGAGMLTYGLAVIAQGPERWRGPIFRSALTIAPSWVWGLAIATFGLLALIGSFKVWFHVRNLGLYGGGLWFGVFGYSVVSVASHDPNVTLTSSIPYAMVAVAMCLVARAREERTDARHAPRP